MACRYHGCLDPSAGCVSEVAAPYAAQERLWLPSACHVCGWLHQQVWAVVLTAMCYPISLLPQGNEDESMDQDNAGAGSFQYLLALHALTAADPSLAAPAADPQRYVRLLAPYTAGLSNVPAAPTAGRMSPGGRQPVLAQGVC